MASPGLFPIVVYSTSYYCSHDMTLKVNPSTPQHKCWGLLRIDPERRFTHRHKGRSLAPPNGSTITGRNRQAHHEQS
jgi:hypothetical protein